MHLTFAWRLAAVAAIVVYFVTVMAVVLLLLTNIIFALLLGLTVVGLFWGGWLLVTGKGRRYRWGLVLLIVGGLALAAELIYFLRDSKNVRAFALLAMASFLYLGLISMLRRKYWHEARALGSSRQPTEHFNHPVLIINPKAGNGRSLKAHVDELARNMHIQVMMTQKGIDVEVVARQAVAAGADVLGISGGDGSIGAVAKVALEQQLPMVVLPGGTKCHFARDLGLDPKRIADALAGFNGVRRHIDVASINGRIFLNNVSFGLYADIVDHPSYREHKLRVSRSVLRSLVTGQQPPYDLRFMRGEVPVRQAVQVLVGVNRYDTLNVFELGHRQRLDEGVLQITEIDRLDDALMRELITTMSLDVVGNDIQSLPGFHQWTAQSLLITSAHETLIAGVDGEREEHVTPVKVNIMPGALSVIVPAEGDRNRPLNPFGKTIVRRVWQAAARGT